MCYLYGCESWTINKAEHWRIDAFELWCWRRLLRVPWTARRSNQSILKEIRPEYSLEGLMLKLKLQYFVVKNWLIWKDPDAGKDWRREKKGMTEDERVGWHHWTGVWVDSWVGDGQGGLPCCSPRGSQRVRHDWDWTELNLNLVFLIYLTIDLCKWRWLCVKLEAWEVWGRTFMSRINQEYGIEVKILQARLQQCMNRELLDIQAGFRKGRGTRDQIANIRWIIKKAREFQKNICYCC